MTDYCGRGRTHSQMQEAPQKAVFVWVNGLLDYPKLLAHKIGREDLEIVAPYWLEEHWRGRELTGLVIDHACQLTERQRHGRDGARTRIRAPGQ